MHLLKHIFIFETYLNSTYSATYQKFKYPWNPTYYLMIVKVLTGPEIYINRYKYFHFLPIKQGILIIFSLRIRFFKNCLLLLRETLLEILEKYLHKKKN